MSQSTNHRRGGAYSVIVGRAAGVCVVYRPAHKTHAVGEHAPVFLRFSKLCELNAGLLLTPELKLSATVPPDF